jgi:hypothetical protein
MYHVKQARLPGLGQGELRELLTDAWCMVVPKRSWRPTWSAPAERAAAAYLDRPG